MPSPELEPYPFPAAIFVNREVEFGQVYLVSDRLISIPDADRVRGTRTYHDHRRVVIVQNDRTNYTTFPTVLVAPLTSRTDVKRRHDIELFPEEEKAISKPVLIRLKLMQPILRADLGDYLGVLSDSKQAEIMQAILEIFGASDD
ncbi:MAG: type II toxin-antitoxin system PemK/MazF family toxin [Firmicutes bacterium]|nr:type II toxin-antitoxin system PemK/MazF family toxin [Bacillota bacterium]